MPTSPSYRTADCCPGTDCSFLDHHDNQLCWGQVEVVDEDYSDEYPELASWVHGCQGHVNSYGGPYEPEPKEG